MFTTEFGEPCDPRNAFRALPAAATEAGLPHAGCTLRHSAAITGDIYGHVSPDVARQVMSTLGEAFDR